MVKVNVGVGLILDLRKDVNHHFLRHWDLGWSVS